MFKIVYITDALAVACMIGGASSQPGWPQSAIDDAQTNAAEHSTSVPGRSPPQRSPLQAAEHGYIPDAVLRYGIRFLLSVRLSQAPKSTNGRLQVPRDARACAQRLANPAATTRS